MLYKKFILLAISVFALMLFFKAECYERWISKFIINDDVRISDQFEKTGVEERRAYRFGNVYLLCQYMKKTLDSASRNKQNIILLPPNDYMRARGVPGFNTLPEPAEFYYHIGLKTVWTTSPDVEKANWAVVVTDGQKPGIAFVPIKSPDELHQLLAIYKKYKPSL